MHLLEVNMPEINFKSQFSIHGISNSHGSVIAKKATQKSMTVMFFQLLVNKILIRRIQTVCPEW